jgi:hypothetical protein
VKPETVCPVIALSPNDNKQEGDQQLAHEESG